MSSPPLDSWLFPVREASVEAVATIRDITQRITVPNRKALVDEQTGRVLGIVGRDYQLITNARAVELGREVAARAFPNVSPVEWHLLRASGPRTRGHVHLDLLHAAHVMNLWDNPDGSSEIFTPFLRVTNSFNGARALRFDFGYMRKHCSNGVVFEEKVASLVAAHNRRDIRKLKVDVEATRFEGVEQRFSNLLQNIRSIGIGENSSLETARHLLRWPKPRPTDSEQRTEQLGRLDAHLSNRHSHYRRQLGPNAYALFNTLTDIAARPPASPHFRRDRSTIERWAGQWLKDFVTLARDPGFDFGRYLAALRTGDRTR